MKPEQKKELYILLNALCEGIITDSQYQQLDEWLSNDPEACQIHVDFSLIWADLKYFQSSLYSRQERIDALDRMECFESDNFADTEFWKALAEAEQKACPVEVPRRPYPQNISPVKAPRIRSEKINKISLFTAVLTTTVMIFVIGVVPFLQIEHEPAACVLEAMNAEWIDSALDYRQGDILNLNQSLYLKKGFAKIRMNDQSIVVIESPCKFTLEGEDQLLLTEGKITVQVPKEAIGFMVRTPSALVVDYGTELGVLVDQYAQTETHVRKGEVEMRVGSNTRVFGQSIRLRANQAARVSGQTLTVIPPSIDKFTYEIPSPFEMYAKLLGAMAYIRPIAYNSDSVRDIISNSELQIQTTPNLSIVPGPMLGNGKQSLGFRIQGALPSIQIGNLRSLPQHSEGFNSIGFWIYFESIRQQFIYADYDKGKKNRLMIMNSDGHLEHSAYSAQGKWRIVSSSEPLKPGTWYFVMITRTWETKNEKIMYINGKPAARTVIDAMNDTISLFDFTQIGGDSDQIQGMDGAIAEFLIFPRALTEQEIQHLYQSAVVSGK